MTSTVAVEAFPALPVIDLDRIDPAIIQDVRLRPEGLLTGSLAAAAVADSSACRLTGSAIAFTLVEVIVRYNGYTSTGSMSPRALLAWADRLGPPLKRRLDEQWSALTTRRENWAGLSLDRPLVMGIVNVTPDSFYIGLGTDPQTPLAVGRAMLAAGADILDIGAESTRPGAAAVSEEEEIHRLEPVIRGLVAEGAVVSVDTRHATVMRAAIGWGAKIVNDVSALEGDDSLAAVADSDAAVVLMHMRGEPGTMQKAPTYDLPSFDIADYLSQRIACCVEAGIPLHRIVVDPGIGFGKTVAHNLELLARLGLFHGLGCGVLVGLSRKSTIGRVSGGAPVEARLPGSIAGALQSLRQGAQILRVHDVAETRQAIAMWEAIAAGA